MHDIAITHRFADLVMRFVASRLLRHTSPTTWRSPPDTFGVAADVAVVGRERGLLSRNEIRMLLVEAAPRGIAPTDCSITLSRLARSFSRHGVP